MENKISLVEQLIETIIQIDNDGDLSEGIDGDLYLGALDEFKNLKNELELFKRICTVSKIDETEAELLQLRADALASQSHNAAVIDRIVQQLRDAGYSGTLSEMVDAACEASKLIGKIRNDIDTLRNDVNYSRGKDFLSASFTPMNLLDVEVGLDSILSTMPLPQSPAVSE